MGSWILTVAMSETQSATGAGSTDTSPIIAALISLIIPGVGMIVAGEPVKGRGIYWLVGTVIAGFLLMVYLFVIVPIVAAFTLGFGALLGLVGLGWPIIHLLAALDSYVQVDKIYVE